ncbi:MAG TPA: hypothetical protein VFD40_00640 [Candidatus Paceibacterota bacterium]|nr:hypothetical protein [Candidatus Paceibacterota bacterium]
MDEKRKGQIALAILKIRLRQETSIRDIANIKRVIGNIIKDPEMIAIKATNQELLDIFNVLIVEVFQKQMKNF